MPLEVITAYCLLLAPYPVIMADYATESPLQVGLWLGLGLAVLFVIRRFVKHRLATVLWVSGWFMAGTLICGSVTLAPWPATASSYGVCATAFSLSFCLVANIAIAHGLMALFLRWRRRREVI